MSGSPDRRYELVLLDNPDPSILKQLEDRINEDIKGRSRCPNPGKIGKDGSGPLLPYENVNGATVVQFIVLEKDAGVIGYCMIRFMYDDTYTDSKDTSTKLVYISSACSFTRSKDTNTPSKRSVEDIIGSGRQNVGRFIFEALGDRICSKFGVESTIFIFKSEDDAVPKHIKNGAKMIEDGDIEELKTLTTAGVNIFDKMNITKFLGVQYDGVEQLKDSLRYHTIFRYPNSEIGRPAKRARTEEGGRRRRKTRAKKPRVRKTVKRRRRTSLLRRR